MTNLRVEKPVNKNSSSYPEIKQDCSNHIQKLQNRGLIQNIVN